MRLYECYRTLDLTEGVSDEDVKRAHRELTKVWHPDRFAHDPAMQARAEEKLKRINEAFETIAASRSGDRDFRSDRTSGATVQQPKGNYRAYVFMFSILGIVVLLRRPTPGGFLIAAVCLVIVIAFLSAMRRARR